MSHAFVTVIAAVPVGKIPEVRALIHALGNPAEARIAEALDGMNTVHFASLNVFEASAGDRGHLVLELSGDGGAEELLRQLDRALASQLGPVFAHAPGRGSGSLSRYWKDHVVAVGQGLLSNPGVHFAGTPAMSVDRIRREAGLAERAATMLEARPAAAGPALDRLRSVRAALTADPDWKWALEPEALPHGGTGGDLPGTVLASLPAVLPLALPFAATFLWPLAILALAVFAIAWGLRGFAPHGIPSAFALAVVATVGAGLVTAGLLYGLLRRREAAEVPVDRPPDRHAVDAVMARENFARQNHLAALSVMKPGILRRGTLRLAFWFVAQLSASYYRPGFLGTLGTIHFARWVTVPGTRDLLFLSNYGGSWESYLEDFITKAHTGLTGIWSNTVGFPRTSNLFQDGAADGERFKRWARRQQIPTGFWYSAYPGLTTANIRTNAVVRQGLGAAMTEDEARRWLSLFGSQSRPAATLESSEIQSIVFGGLGFLREATAILFALGDDARAAKAWLRDVLPNVAFADGRSLREATILGLAASGLRRLGIPEESIATFPCAFVDGMAAPWRSRALGDVGSNAPRHWWWGGDPDDPDQRVDGVLILYGRTTEDLDRLRLETAHCLNRHGHALRRAVRLRALPDLDAAALDKSEPFGFLDGISQPVIRGTYKALRNADPIHVVEPGEFVLGYPDNRGSLPPTPTIAALRDPGNLLPVAADPAPGFSRNTVNADRDLGRNGTFLVVRQLEQEVESFWAYCRREGERLAPWFPPGVRAGPDEFIAAKIVGRWRDGSPLVRYPRWPASVSPRPSHPLARTTGGPARSPIPAPIAATAMRTAPGTRAASHAAPATAADDPRAPARPPFEPDNDFLFGAEDPQGLKCPYGAHVRRANPRESFDPGSRNQLDITNRHRLLRVGRPYLPEGEQKPGLLFMCLNGDLERQFEFVQQTWAEGASFHGLANERDPLIGSRLGTDAYSVPTRGGPMTLRGLPTFVQPRGGGYFLVPGRRTLAFLACVATATNGDRTA